MCNWCFGARHSELERPLSNRGGSSETIIRHGTGGRGQREGEMDRLGLKIHILESSA